MAKNGCSWSPIILSAISCSSPWQEYPVYHQIDDHQADREVKREHPVM